MGSKEREVAVEREEVSRLVGRKVAVRLNNVEATGVELVATLGEVRDDGVVLSEVGELGPGPTMFCPWDSLWRVRERPPWLAPPHEEEPAPEGPWPGEPYDLREVPTGGVMPEPSPERHREPSARTLERVVPIAEKRTVGDTTVALTSLEVYGEGVGVLRWQASFGEDLFRSNPDFGFGIPGLELEIRDHAGRTLPWSPRGSHSGGEEADGDVEVWDLPESGNVEVVVPRLVADAYAYGEYQGEGPSYDGPWTFSFSI